MTEPHSNPPQIPHYASGVPSTRGSAGAVILRFFIGLIAGSIVSVIVWFAGWKLIMGHNADAMIWIVPAVKLLVGIALLFIRGWRSMGAGLLVSIAIGVLIFFGACAVNMDWNGLH